MNLKYKLFLGLFGFLFGCSNSNYKTKEISEYVLKNGYDCHYFNTRRLCYKFPDETEIQVYDEQPIRKLDAKDSIVIVFKRKQDVSRFAREGRIIDNNLDGKLELCDPEDECKEKLSRINKTLGL